jgi:hypothetical protein
MEDILGEIRTACEEFLNIKRETLFEKRPVAMPQHTTHELLFLKYRFTETFSIFTSFPKPVL